MVYSSFFGSIVLKYYPQEIEVAYCFSLSSSGSWVCSLSITVLFPTSFFSSFKFAFTFLFHRFSALFRGFFFSLSDLSSCCLTDIAIVHGSFLFLVSETATNSTSRFWFDILCFLRSIYCRCFDQFTYFLCIHLCFALICSRIHLHMRSRLSCFLSSNL